MQASVILLRQQRLQSGEKVGLNSLCLHWLTKFENLIDLGIGDTFGIPKEVRPRMADVCIM